MLYVLGLLAFTVYLFAFEVVRVDVAAVSVMVLLGLSTLIPGLNQIINVNDLFSGFSSNAVISIIAIMIIGAGLDKTGLMSRVAGLIMRLGGAKENSIIPLISGTVAVISSFMQNVGAAALFLPVVSRIAARTGLPISRLLMPMGFCAILGGTMTMVGSSPLILLNDLILNSNKVLPAAQQMETFSLFSVTPIGLALVFCGIAYFILLGTYVLPTAQRSEEVSWGGRTAQYFKSVYGLEADIFEVRVPPTSRLVARRIDVVERAAKVRIIAHYNRGNKRIAPAGPTTIESGAMLAVMADPATMKTFIEQYEVELRPQLNTFAEDLIHTKSGICELVLPPNSNLLDKTVREIVMRQTYGLAILAIHRGGETIREGVRDLPLKAGDTLVCHSTWENLSRLKQNRNFVVVTTEYPQEELRPQKVPLALVCFAVALSLVLFTDLRLSIALLAGAIGMVLFRVLTMDEAYSAVSWRSVFLLASLIPLGQAVENTGTAAWIAQQTLALMGDVPIWVLQTAMAVLATFFTLVMSNVGATVLLVPLAVNIAVSSGANPAVFALTVAIATSNSFLLPTHQVNALIMGPAGYRVTDFMKAGGVMTVLFLIVALLVLNLLY